MTAQAPGRPVMADSASSWRDSLIRLRTRVISNPRVQRWAAASPLLCLRTLLRLCCERVKSITILKAEERVEHEALFDRALGYETLQVKLTGLTV